MKTEDILATIADGGEFDVTEAIRELSKRVLALEAKPSAKKTTDIKGEYQAEPKG